MPDLVWIENVVFPIFGMAMGALAMFGVYRTINRHLDRRHEREMTERAAGGGSQMIDELRTRVEELEEVALRVQDVEERLDFAERMLAQNERKQLDFRKRAD